MAETAAKRKFKKHFWLILLRALPLDPGNAPRLPSAARPGTCKRSYFAF